MRMWLLAGIENILRDIMDQLIEATEARWHRTKPDHYRAILAAWESALREGRELDASQVGLDPIPAISERRTAEDLIPFAFRRSWRPLLSLVPVSRSRQ